MDVVLTRDIESIDKVSVQNDLLSDRCTIFFELDTAKPPLSKMVIQYRKLKSIDIDKFKADLSESGLPDFQHEDVDVLVDKRNTTMAEILEKHAPLKTKEVTIHPDAPWINDEVKEQKRKKRKAERKWRKTGLVAHKDKYTPPRDHIRTI